MVGYPSVNILRASTYSLLHSIYHNSAHRLPKTKLGWFYYHKYKQHEALHAAYKGGFKYSSRFAGIGAVFCGSQWLLEESPLVNDGLKEGWVCSLGAGLITTGVFSLAGKFAVQIQQNN
jgi:hypothetical protein